jgi:hypothetical protein
MSFYFFQGYIYIYWKIKPPHSFRRGGGVSTDLSGGEIYEKENEKRRKNVTVKGRKKKDKGKIDLKR